MTWRPAALTWLALLAAIAATLACQRQETAAPHGPATGAGPARHLVLVTIDTLRADHVGAYGGDVPTPHLDALAQDGAMLTQATAHAPLTRPSHVSLFTGRLPTETGIRDNVSPVLLSEDHPLLAETLRDQGFTTGGFVSSVVVARHTGLDRGFGTYSDRFDATEGDPQFLDTAQKRGDRTLAEALAWLDTQRASERIFLWLHLYDPHDPYAAPAPFGSRFADRPYAGEVAFSDALVGQLDEALGRLGLRDDTLLVVTSDHGEGLGEHGERLHGFFAYQSTLHVPLLVRGPGVAPGTRVETPVGLVDLVPTALDLLGLAPAPGAALAGRSLAEALRGGEAIGGPVSPVYAESLVPQLHFGWSALRTVRDGDYKYIDAPRPELYDLAADPGETTNRIDDQRRVARRLREQLDTFRQAETAPGASVAASMPPEQRERLLALGYLGGSTPADTDTPGADPKDKIEAFRRANEGMRSGLEALHAGDPATAVTRFEALLRDGVASAELYLYLGKGQLALQRFAGATASFRETTRREPSHVGAWLGLAEALLRQNDAPGALDALRDGQAFSPRSAALYREEARILARGGQPEAARAALSKALPLAPDDAFLRAALAEVETRLGQPERALEALREATRLAPADGRYWNALGMALGATPALDEAARAFREATRLTPEDPRYAYNLGLALLRLERTEEARPVLERVLVLDPGFQPALDRLQDLAAASVD